MTGTSVEALPTSGAWRGQARPVVQLVERLVRNNKRAVSLTFTSCDLSRSSEEKSPNYGDLTFSQIRSKNPAGVQNRWTKAGRGLFDASALTRRGFADSRKREKRLRTAPSF